MRESKYIQAVGFHRLFIGRRCPIVLIQLMVIMLNSSCAWTDWHYGRIPNWLTFPAIVLALLLRCIEGTGKLVDGLHGMGIGAAPLLLLWLQGGMGGGDVKLMAANGALLGGANVLHLLIWTAVTGGIMATWIMSRKHGIREITRMIKRTVLLLASSAPAAPDREYVPYGICIAVGAIIVALQVVAKGSVHG